ncbi:protease pro-enzyme activation domain-containing protein [Acidilobus saccharovorans]|uniref:protease pro-enzyme activation domain-containing protein n=1 Tax=Acidilobus saccharovorans TaxID=242703 RepID=UPI0006621E6C|nr:protease pro-enzyme activation domain-containing protein [Acidilobus saccharovorans]
MKGVLGLLLVAILLIAMVSPAEAEAMGIRPQQPPQRLAEPLPGFRLVGQAPPQSQVVGVLYVPLRDVPLIFYYAQAVSDPGSPLYHKFLTPSQAASMFYPSGEVREAVGYLRSHGLRVIAVAGSMIAFSGPASAIERALGVSIGVFSNGTSSYYAVTGYRGNPLGLLPYVSNVTGLVFRPLLSLASFTPIKGQEVYVTTEAYPLTKVALAYNVTPLYSRGYTGQGVNVGIVDLYGDPEIYQVMSYYDKAFGLPPVNLTVVPIGPYNPNLGVLTGWDVEIDLDVEAVHSIAPRAHIYLYIAAGYLPLSAVIAYIDQHDNVSIVSQSFGIPESMFSNMGAPFYYYNVYLSDVYYALGAAEGITFLAASGNGGGMGYSAGPVGDVNYPASSPWVLAVGGTTTYLDFYPNGSVSSYYSTAWSSAGFVPYMQNVGGSTGGYSAYEPMPWWQEGVAPRPPEGFPHGRAVPDVSANANIFPGVYEVTYNNVTIVEGGTSEASPLTAGLLALVEGYVGHGLGLIAPTLYAMYRAYPAAIDGVTFGYNIPWRARGNYSLVTGLGTINAGQLAFALSNKYIMDRVKSMLPSLSVKVNVIGAPSDLELVPGHRVTVVANITYPDGAPVAFGSFQVTLETAQGVGLTQSMTFNGTLWEAEVTVPANVSGPTLIVVGGSSGGLRGESFIEGFIGYFVSFAYPTAAYPWDPSLGLPVEVNLTYVNGTPGPQITYNVSLLYYNYVTNSYSVYNSTVIVVQGNFAQGVVTFRAPYGYVLMEARPPAFGVVPMFFGDSLQDTVVLGESAMMPGTVEPGQDIVVMGYVLPPVETQAYTSYSTGQSLFDTIALGSNVTVTLEYLNGTPVASSQAFYDPALGYYLGTLKVPQLRPGLYWVLLNASYNSTTLGGLVEGYGVDMIYVGQQLNIRAWAAPSEPAEGQGVTIYADVTYQNGTPVRYGLFSAVLVPKADASAYWQLDGEPQATVMLYYNSTLGLWVGSAVMPSLYSQGSTGLSGLYLGEPWVAVITGASFNGMPARPAVNVTIMETKYAYYANETLGPGSFYPYDDLFYDVNITGYSGPIEDSILNGTVYIVDSNVTLVNVRSLGRLYLVNSTAKLMESQLSYLGVRGGTVYLYASDVVNRLSSNGTVSYVLPSRLMNIIELDTNTAIANLSRQLRSIYYYLNSRISSLNQTAEGLSLSLRELNSTVAMLSGDVAKQSEELSSNVTQLSLQLHFLSQEVNAANSTALEAQAGSQRALREAGLYMDAMVVSAASAIISVAALVSVTRKSKRGS